MDVIPTVTQ